MLKLVVVAVDVTGERMTDLVAQKSAAWFAGGVECETELECEVVLSKACSVAFLTMNLGHRLLLLLSMGERNLPCLDEVDRYSPSDSTLTALVGLVESSKDGRARTGTWQQSSGDEPTVSNLIRYIHIKQCKIVIRVKALEVQVTTLWTA